MRPRAAAAAALALAAAALAAPGAQAGGSPGAAAAADCVPVQHSKRVTKRVKVRRGGKIVKVKRRKTIRWETCEQPSAGPVIPTPLAACPEPASSLGVIARDNNAMPRYSLSRLCVNAGPVHVELSNEGEDPHHVFVRPAASASQAPTYRIPDQPPPFYELGPWDGMGAPPTAEADIALTAGDWYLWCDLLTHEEQGMNVTLQVR